MLKVLLIDDEPFILQGLQILIDWNEEGYEIAATLSNGKEAYEYLKENKVDLIISDIQMPVMTGLELLETIRNENISDARFALLTGYDDFSYAQTAIRNNCMDYILKPVQKDDILSLLRNVSKLESEKKQDTEIQKQLEDAYLARNIMSIIKGKFDDRNLEYVKKHLQLSGNIRYVYIEVSANPLEEKADSDLRVHQRQLHQVCRDILKEYANHFIFDVSYDENSYDVGFIYCDNLATRYDITDSEFFDSFLKKIQTSLMRPVKMICGKSVSDITSVAKSYSSCCMLYSIMGFHNEKSIYIYEDEVSVGQNTSYLCKTCIDAIILAIQNCDENAIKEAVEALYKEMVSIDENINVANLNINYLLFQLIHIATEQDDKVNQEEIVRYISENSFEDSISRGSAEHMTKFAIAYAEYLSSLRKNVSRGLITNIDKEIEEHFSENITLKSLGDKYFINSSYLGQIFRKAHDMSFKDYLTKLRVEKASAMLLKTDMKINKIAEEVGYNDCDYFIRKFIELKGCTPSKYRRNNSVH